MTKTTWRIPATITSVVDGDTVKADLDLGWHITLLNQSIRLARINCPELNTPEGVKALEFTAAKVPPGTMVTVLSARLDKYGRVLGEIFLANGDVLSSLLLDEGLATIYRGIDRDA